MNAVTQIAGARPSLGSGQSDSEWCLLALAKGLARPVARGWLPIDQADGTLLCASLRASRSNEIKSDPVDFAVILSHILRLHVHQTTVHMLVEDVERIIE